MKKKIEKLVLPGNGQEKDKAPAKKHSHGADTREAESGRNRKESTGPKPERQGSGH